MDQNCTTDQYGNTGCIGTAASTHGGVLPMTGADIIGALLLALAVIIVGVALRLSHE